MFHIESGICLKAQDASFQHKPNMVVEALISQNVVKKGLETLSNGSNYRWVVLFASFFVFVAFAFVFQLVPPLLTTISSPTNLNLRPAEAGLLMSTVTIPGILLALPVGLVVNRYGFRIIGTLSTVLVAVGSLVTATADTFPIALLGRFVLGVGGAFVVVGTPTVIPQWFSHKELGKAMGVFGTNMPVATIIAFPAATILAQSFDWHFPFYVGTVVALVAASFFALAAKEGPLKGDTKTDPEEVKQAVRNTEVWKAGLVWMLFNTAAIAYLSWAKTLFESFKGVPALEASILASVLMYAAVGFVPIFGWASDKIGRRKPFLIAGSVAMALTLIITSYSSGSSLLVSVMILGIAAASVPPIVMTIPPQNLPPRLAGTAFSVITLCQNVGVTLSAPYAGYLIQTTQYLPSIFLGISLFAFAAAVTALTLRTK